MLVACFPYLPSEIGDADREADVLLADARVDRDAQDEGVQMRST